MKWFRPVTKEQIAAARAVPLLEYLQKRGYELRKEGRYYRLKDHDSLVIDSQKNQWHWNSRGIKSASTPDFLHLYEGLNFEDAVMELINGHPVTPRSPPKRQEEKKEKLPTEDLTIPERHTESTRVWTYLVRSRHLASTIVNALLLKRLLYEAAGSHNAVFVRYDGEIPRYYYERGTITYGKPYKHEPAGADKRWGWRYIGEDPTTVIVGEAIIDVLSFATLMMRAKRNWQSFSLLALGGSTVFDALDQYIRDYPQTRRILVITDADPAGDKAAEQLRTLFADKFDVIRCRPTKKDWNDVLTVYATNQDRADPARTIFKELF